MSRSPILEAVAGDALVGTDAAAYISPSQSRTRVNIISDDVLADNEQTPLLGPAPLRKPFYRARPLWLVPFAVTAALVRGMTLAPRVEVYTQLSCGSLRHPYNNTFSYPPTNVSNQLLHTTPSILRPIHFRHITIPDPPSNEPDGTDDPRRLPSSRCLTDPAVQAGAARLQTIMVVIMGSLSALTSGFWGHFSERHGRTSALALATLGLFMTDLIFILVSTPNSSFSGHGHKLLLLSPIIEGSLGGWSALQAACSAYISDCTSPGSRATVFSRFTGMFYVGFSLGPSIGGWIISKGIGTQPGQEKNVTVVFWTAVFFSLVNLLLVTFVFPESLPKEKRLKSSSTAGSRGADKGKQRAVEVDQSAGTSGAGHGLEDNQATVRQGVIARFLSPLRIFLPVILTTPAGRRRADWSLTLLACTLFIAYLSSGVYQLKYLYAGHVYGWGAETLSYYISYLGGIRAIWLLVLLPFIIATFKPKHGPSPLAAGASTSSSTGTTSAPVKLKMTKPRLRKEIAFDLFLTRLSLLMDVLANIVITLLPSPGYQTHVLVNGPSSEQTRRSEVMFVLASSLNSLASGVVPAVQSLALCIMQARVLVTGGPEDAGDNSTGKLFGALAVLQATGQMILGPLVFGLVYSETVAHHPKAIFGVAGGLLILAILCAFLVTSPVAPLPRGKGKRRKRFEDEEVERGRSRVSKNLFAPTYA